MIICPDCDNVGDEHTPECGFSFQSQELQRVRSELFCAILARLTPEFSAEQSAFDQHSEEDIANRVHLAWAYVDEAYPSEHHD